MKCSVLSKNEHVLPRLSLMIPLLSVCCAYIVISYHVANSTAAAKKKDQPGILELQNSYLLNPENSKTFLILSQPKMCQKYTFLLPRAHFLGATGAPTEPVHESLLKTPILSRPTV